jgi:NAD-dependent dihydropyrimidine dehydrogenase PreA subunit
MQAFVEHPDACHGCGLCVQACPEKAIKLQKQPPQAAEGFKPQRL